MISICTCFSIASIAFVDRGWHAQEADEPIVEKPSVSRQLMRVESLYNGVERPVMLTIDEEAGDDLSIVLLEDTGNILAPSYEVEAGETLDLASAMPVIWRIRRACYLQLLRADDPVGSALVLQPMLSRPPIWTQQEYRPDGRTSYTRIVGWGTEPPDGWREQDVSSAGGSETDDDRQSTNLQSTEPSIEPEAFSGLRIYPERDVLLETSHGSMRIALAPEEAPNTAWNFRHLVSHDFYDDVIFHRVVPFDRNGRPFVIQGGDPTGTGNGGPGYWLPIEPSRLRHDFGVLSMARADDPDSAGSQFFICLSRAGTARLDGQYCAFGYVVDGASTIKRIAEVEIENAATGRPVEPPVIVNAETTPAPPRVPDFWRWEHRVSPNENREPPPIRVPR